MSDEFLAFVSKWGENSRRPSNGDIVHEYEIQLTDELKAALHSQGYGEFHPELIAGRSDVLDFNDVVSLGKNISADWPWFLTFSSYVHNRSLETLYCKAASYKGPALIIIKSTCKQVFGALLSEQPKLCNGYYGTSESFLFQCRPNFKVYRPTGKDKNFLLGNEDSFAVGTKNIFGKSALHINSALTEGWTVESPTFRNAPLVQERNFQIKILECWHFGLPL